MDARSSPEQSLAEDSETTAPSLPSGTPILLPALRTGELVRPLSGLGTALADGRLSGDCDCEDFADCLAYSPAILPSMKECKLKRFEAIEHGCVVPPVRGSSAVRWSSYGTLSRN